MISKKWEQLSFEIKNADKPFVKAILIIFFMSCFAFSADRSLSLIIKDGLLYPSTIVGFSGEKLTIFSTNAGKSASCAIFEGHDSFIASKRGEISEVSFILQAPGRYRVYCPGAEFSGELVVLKPKKLVNLESNYWEAK